MESKWEYMRVIICGMLLWEGRTDVPNLWICLFGMRTMIICPILVIGNHSEDGKNLISNNIKEQLHFVESMGSILILA